MKNIMLIAMMLPFCSFAQIVTKLVPANNVFVPNGFDDNDNTEIVISGYLPDSCYKAPNHSVKVEGSKITITLNAMYQTGAMGACAEVIVPFIETVRLGALDANTYDVVVVSANPQKLMSKVVVKKASITGVDDYDYAYVTGVRHLPGNRKIMIDGYNVSDCFVLDQVKIDSNNLDTFVILPIMKQINDFCPRKMTPVHYEVTIPASLKRNEVLLHVRSMQGNSVNSIFYSQIK